MEFTGTVELKIIGVEQKVSKEKRPYELVTVLGEHGTFALVNKGEKITMKGDIMKVTAEVKCTVGKYTSVVITSVA